ncbi:hypothetical protein L0156_08690 [bacterium]|nr:hypothetical protein [bacterium]
MSRTVSSEDLLLEFIEQNKDRDPVETARLFGIDLSLLRYNLSLSQPERVRQLQSWMQFQSNLQWSKSKKS